MMDYLGYNEKRVSSVKCIAESLGANYYSGLNEFDSTFDFKIDKEKSNGNFIVGNISNYDYCFLEYYYYCKGKGDYDGYLSEAYLKIKFNDFPSFHLKTRSSAVSQLNDFFYINFGNFFLLFILLLRRLNIEKNLINFYHNAYFQYIPFIVL